MKDMEKPRVGISTCLLGKSVRYNAGHKLDYYLKDYLGQYVDFVPVCPEVESGMGVPREAVHLHETPLGTRMITEKSGEDVTDRMQSWILKKMDQIDSLNLSGFILKSKSPSCGLFRTRLYREDKPPSLNSRGLFAKALADRFPDLIIEEEGRLHNPDIRDNFIQMLFIRYRWKALLKEYTVSALMLFHKELKYTLMSHDPTGLKRLGQIAAGGAKETLDKSFREYYALLNEILRNPSDRKKRTNVLEHIMGYFKKNLTGEEKAELKEIIGSYKRGWVPLIVPVTLLNHYVRKYKQDYLSTQYFLNPHPLELMLRNHV